MEIEKTRLRIRTMRAEDVVGLVHLWIDPKVTRFLGGPRRVGVLTADFEAYARTAETMPFECLPVEEKRTGRLIGQCALLKKEIDGAREIELVYVINAAEWGKGYATEAAAALARYALGELGLARLIALIHPENAASERVALKLGMRFEKETRRPGGYALKVFTLAGDEYS